MNRTVIEYADLSWNPVTGCLGPGGTPDEPRRCPYCYAHRLAKGGLRKVYLTNPNVAPGCDPDDPFSPRFWPERLEQPLRRRNPARIFVADMGDLLHDELPWSWVMGVRSTLLHSPQHTFLILTKNPSRYRYFNWPDNCWLGTTITCEAEAWRWVEMARVDARVRWLSLEPLLGDLSLPLIPPFGEAPPLPDWLVVGGLTGAGARQPDKQWVPRGGFGVPVFHKDNLDCEGLGIQRRREMPR